MPRMYVWQFTLVLIAKCHRTISWIMSNYFPMNLLQDISMCIDSRQSIQLGPTTWGSSRYKTSNCWQFCWHYCLRGEYSLISPTPLSMRKFFFTCDSYANKFDIIFNASKSKFLVCIPGKLQSMSFLYWWLTYWKRHLIFSPWAHY